MATKRAAIPTYSPKLPVAPEFVIGLHETVFETLTQWLKDHGVPAEVVELANQVVYLQTYVEWCGTLAPDSVQIQNYGIEADVIKAINAIAVAGGVFHGETSVSVPRKVGA